MKHSRKIVWPAAIVMVLVAWAAVSNLPENNAEGSDSYLNAFGTQYPAVVGTRLATCGTCHYDFGGDGTLNDYGQAYLDSGSSFTAIESLDSDADGTSNLNEINALFMPGLSCTTYTLAIGAPVNLADYVDPLNPGCSAAPPTPTASPVPTATAPPVPTATATPVPTATASPVPTATATPVPTATASPTPTPTASPVPTATATPAPTATASPAPTA